MKAIRLISIRMSILTSRRMMSIAAVAVNTIMTGILRNIHTSIRMTSFAIVALNTAMTDILRNIHMNTRMTDILMTSTVTAAVSMTTAATHTEIRTHITPPGIRRTASVNSAIHMRNTAISAAKVLPTASAICLMLTVKKKFIF